MRAKSHTKIFTDERIKHIEKRLGLWVAQYLNEDGDGMLLDFIATELVGKALYSWYIKQDIATAKQYFFVAAKCHISSSSKPRGINLWTCHDFMFPLLSDSPALIGQFSTLSPIGYEEKKHDPKSGEFQSYLAQTAILKDDKKLIELTDLLLAQRDKKHKELNGYYVQFYKGLIAGDIPQMESALAYFGARKSQVAITEDFLAFHAVVMCKLAWLRGYEVQVESPLVPMAFMPIAPLAHYDDVYEFLKPNWVAPIQASDEPKKKSLIGKLFGN